MRRWTIVAAGLIAASVGAAAAVVPTAAGQSTRDGQTYYFCSPGCKARFDAEGRAAGADGVLAIRPEKLHLDGRSGMTALGPARIESVVFQGSFKRVLASSTAHPGLMFISRAEAETPLSPGETCRPCCNADDLVLLSR